MKKLLFNKTIFFQVITLFTMSCLFSCTNQKKRDNKLFFDPKPLAKKPIIDYSLIDCLNESNQKIIKLSHTSFEITKDVATLQLLLEIKRNHENIEKELIHLTQKNLIIIPRIIYQHTIDEDTLKSNQADLFLLKKLGSEIKNQITLLDSIEKTNLNNDFKMFARKHKKTLNQNNETLTHILNSDSEHTKTLLTDI